MINNIYTKGDLYNRIILLLTQPQGLDLMKDDLSINIRKIAEENMLELLMIYDDNGLENFFINKLKDLGYYIEERKLSDITF